jgi:hypothetical protein
MRTVMLVGALLLVACGDDGGHPADARVDTMGDTTTDTAVCAGSKIIFLNRAGGVYNAGEGDDATTNTTRVLTSGSFNVTAYPFGDSDWATINTCVTSAFAPFGVSVTDVDPGTTPHHEIVFTTSYAVWPGGNPAPSSISSANCPGIVPGLPQSGIAFVFSSIYGSSRPDLDCTHAVSQLASEISGLDHSLDCQDFLGSGLTPCGPRAFLDLNIQCGETSPRACQCGGTEQNSFQTMKAAFCP